MIQKPAILVLADGTVFEGESVGASGHCVGELVFNTAMTGYQEMLTDPSYASQIITLTTAHVGNTGCNPDDMESSRVWATGLVMRDCVRTPSNYRSTQSLPDWLKKHGVVAIDGIDTRQLTHKLREHGAIGACISTDVSNVNAAKVMASSFAGLDGVDLAKKVSGIKDAVNGRSPLNLYVIMLWCMILELSSLFYAFFMISVVILRSFQHKHQQMM